MSADARTHHPQLRQPREVRRHAWASPDTNLPFFCRSVGRLWGGSGMKHTFKAAVAALVLAVGFAGSAAAGPREDAAREDAAAAYRKGDHATGLRLMRPLAEHGDVRAQVGLGLMYEFGYGDYGAATSWYRKAAEQGETSSQVKLGHMYSGGLGVPQDYATLCDRGELVSESSQPGKRRGPIGSRGHVHYGLGRSAGLCHCAHVVQFGGGSRAQRVG
jgi:hypothetical protein